VVGSSGQQQDIASGAGQHEDAAAAAAAAAAEAEQAGTQSPMQQLDANLQRHWSTFFINIYLVSSGWLQLLNDDGSDMCGMQLEHQQLL
jgi:hypothetical protein